MHMVDGTERFSGPVVQVLAINLERVITSNIDIGEIHRRLALDDPLGQRAASTSTHLETLRIEASSDEAVGGPGCFTQHEERIRGEAFRPIHEPGNADVSQSRDDLHGLDVG